MPPNPLPQYTFVPWLRRGIAAKIDIADRLGAQPDAGPAGRTPIPVSLMLDYTPVGGPPLSQHLTAASRTVDILGPGDVGGIRREAIFRTCPEAGALHATPGELAAVEFYEEDFPWRYTPARAAKDTEPAANRFKLRPWIALFVLEPPEFTLVEVPGKLSILQLSDGVVLPPVTETWAWAHAQIGKTVDNPGGVASAIAADADRAFSRLLSPRRLEPSRAYRAFVVPAFESGRLAGLGLNPTAAPTQKPSWGTPAQVRFPVYFDFSFTTHAEGSFETLARRLRPAPAGQTFGKRAMDVSAPGYGLVTGPGATVQLEGALAPLAFQRAAFSAQAASSQAVETILDLGERVRDPNTVVPDDPIVVPPAYGRWHAGVLRIADATNPASTAEAVRLSWLAELNLDLRNRAAAGLGMEVVRQRQDELMERAWQQVGNLRAANQHLREAELAQTAADALFQKHIAAPAAGAERVLILTGAAHAGIVAGTTGTTSLRGAVDASRVPVAAQSAAFRRVTRPQRPVMRRLTGDRNLRRFQNGLIVGMNADPEQALSTAPPRPDPDAGTTFQEVSANVSAAVTELAAEEQTPKRIFLDLVRTELAARRTRGETLALPANSQLLQAFRAAVTTALGVRLPAQPASNTPIRARVQVLVDAIVQIAPDGADAATVTIPQALFAEEYGDGIAGKTYRGVTFVPDVPPPPGTTLSKATAIGAVQEFAASLSAFNTNVLGARPMPPPLPPLASPAGLADHVLSHLAPRRALGERVMTKLQGLRQTLASRPAAAPRPLRPVMAYPTFRDPLFETLRALSQDYIIPNIADLPRESLTLMQPNTRFIESFLAGASHAFAQELLWREYPTDRRGTYFRVFWDTRDALASADRNDIDELPAWTGPLGSQSPLPPNVLVLVVRGALLEKFPDTVIYAQEAAWPGGDTRLRRILAPNGEIRHPIFHARLDPDIVIVGFDLNAEAARGHRPASGDPRPARPGWFIVLMERPGQPRFGLDDEPPADIPEGELPNWSDLSWKALTPPNPRYIQIADNAALAPSNPQAAVFGKSAADMAAILYQSPVLLARHASEMLP